MKRDRLTPSLWIGGPDAATAELPRGQGAFTFGPATDRHTLRACVPCGAARCNLFWCEFCKREPATVESIDGDGFACDGCRDRRDADFGAEGSVAWRSVRR